MSDSERSNLDRRSLLKLGALGLGGAAAGGLGCATAAEAANASAGARALAPRAALDAVPSSIGPAPTGFLAAPPIETVRIGFVGVGLQGGSHVRNFLKIDGVEIVAICDIDAPRAREVAGWVVDDGRRAPTLYTAGDRDYERMCDTEDLDLVFIATPWEWHVPQCVTAMETGSHAATEVPLAYTLDDCWRLVETAEAQQKHCVMMENCNYDRPEMLVFNLAKQGLLGEILHAECGYLHDLRAIKFSDANEGLWRLAHSTQRDANLYPTHGLGPVANVMDINRGDQFRYLVSMSSPSRGLQDYAAEHLSSDDPRRDQTYVLGDVNVCLIKTANGKTIYVSHDTNLPRPYSRIHTVQGSKGIFQGYPNRLHIEGVSPAHRWEAWEDVLPRYDHPLWRDLDERSAGAGHGGMDYIEDYRLIKCLREGLPTDMTVYDGAALSAVQPLTEWSNANGSQPAAFPDFTRGQWRTNPPLEIFRA
ncbi:Gfo/Idh/MocA family protein [Rubrivirga sp. IMCC43871]|uniref:Gfo/Idh/MocA family protein n=1 Tax=Rubrivirga sp. IMCC43871 TaxID=3391575 RepID=UPI0039901EC0